ncbi:MAG: SPFH domain-containing protein, partial [Candidatus Promineifilaceae bacterium]
WLNSATQVIKLKTISFTVPIRGYGNNGVEALDSSNVSFRLWAHAVAKLNPEKAEIAAQRVGLDTMGLVNTITKVGEAELMAAAATKTLQEIIAERQKLAAMAFEKVNHVLRELGYDLALLTITKLDGDAYRKLVKQSEARISMETSVATNREQLAELQDDQARRQLEAEVQASTQKKLAAERLDAEREVETSTISQQELLDIRRHQMRLKQIEREKAAAVAAQEADLNKLQLGQQVGVAEAEKNAKLAKLDAERKAEIRRLQQQREAEIKLKQAETDLKLKEAAATIKLKETEAQLRLKEAEAEIKLKAAEADADRFALEQQREIERSAELTQAEVARLQSEEQARAQRAKEIALIEASQLAESLYLEAEAEANALTLRTDAQAKAELRKAEAEASSAEKRAAAAKIRADATRAETAAPGLAQAQIEEARLMVAQKQVDIQRAEGLAAAEIAQKQVDVKRAEGLAAAEIAQAQANAEAEKLQKIKQVDINAQKSLASLYQEAPVLVDLEKMRMELEHKERITQLQNEMQLHIFEALAPSMKINIIGNSGQVGQVMSNVMAFSQGMNAIGDEIPAIGNLLGNSEQPNMAGLMSSFGTILPHLRSMMSDVNPRMLASLTVNDVVEKLSMVQSGDTTLMNALAGIKQDANVRMIGDMPIQPFLKMLGVGQGEVSAELVETEN